MERIMERIIVFVLHCIVAFFLAAIINSLLLHFVSFIGFRHDGGIQTLIIAVIPLIALAISICIVFNKKKITTTTKE